MCALLTLIRRKPVPYRAASFFKACKNLLSQPVPPPLKPSATGIGCFNKRYENPCFDLYFKVIPNQLPVSESCALLNQLLPPAWSYNPLTTLKIIRNYSDRFYHYQKREVYAKAVYWLHQNHPKTLAFNLPYLVADTIDRYYHFSLILYYVLGMNDVNPSDVNVINHFLFAIHTQRDFRFLHNRVSDFFAEGLKFDIQNLKKNHDHDDEDTIIEVTDASKFCIKVPYLLENIAKRFFPDSTSVEEAVERLRKEVLAPLEEVRDNTNPGQIDLWGYRVVDMDRTNDPLFSWEKYLKEVKESSVDKMVANALLPNQIVLYLNDEDLRQVVELQWKMMVENLKKKYKERMQGILTHSLVVIHPYKYPSSKSTLDAVAMSWTILMSELSVEDAWKGKFIPLIPKPRLELIRGDDLKSKCQFLIDMGKVVTEDDFDEYTDFKSVFDLILQEAVDKGLKPDQMIKRLYVLTLDPFGYKSFTMISRRDWVDENDDVEEMQSDWLVQDYEEMKSKYKEHGYDMPLIVFWKIGHHLEHVLHTPDERGITTISGLRFGRNRDANFVNMFLENDGEMSPQHIMEAILAHQDYDQSLLAVVD